MPCPKCKSNNLRIKHAIGFERVMILLSGTRRYRCRECHHSFRAPDRRAVARADADSIAAHKRAG